MKNGHEHKITMVSLQCATKVKSNFHTIPRIRHDLTHEDTHMTRTETKSIYKTNIKQPEW